MAPLSQVSPEFIRKTECADCVRDTVFAWINANLNQPQQDVINHFVNQWEGSLQFNQGTLSHKLKKQGNIEAMVKVNPVTLSARRQCVVISPEVEQALMLWVDDMLANGHVVNGLLLTTKCKILKDKFNVPPEKHLTDKGWLQGFYWV